MYTAFKYAVFAAIATAVNILVQDLATRVYGGPFALYAAMAAGTLAGLMVKYVLDKKYIFAYQTRHVYEEGAKFFLYSLMGVATTLIFWSVEISFDMLFGTRVMRYVGAVVGLTIGYLIKYLLDKRFVFVRAS